MALERLDWRNDIVPKIKEILNERRQQGVPAWNKLAWSTRNDI